MATGARPPGCSSRSTIPQTTARFVTPCETLKGPPEDAPSHSGRHDRARTGDQGRGAEPRRAEPEARRGKQAESPRAVLEREHRAALGDVADQRRPANLALGGRAAQAR